MFMKILVQQLKGIKDSKRMSQEQIAREIGVTLHTVSRWMRGKFEPSIHLQEKIERFIQQNQ